MEGRAVPFSGKISYFISISKIINAMSLGTLAFARIHDCTIRVLHIVFGEDKQTKKVKILEAKNKINFR